MRIGERTRGTRGKGCAERAALSAGKQRAEAARRQRPSGVRAAEAGEHHQPEAAGAQPVQSSERQRAKHEVICIAGAPVSPPVAMRVAFVLQGCHTTALHACMRTTVPSPLSAPAASAERTPRGVRSSARVAVDREQALPPTEAVRGTQFRRSTDGLPSSLASSRVRMHMCKRTAAVRGRTADC